MLSRELKNKIFAAFPATRGQLRVRRYLRPGLDVEEFFKTLKKRNIRYVVLRWFESLPLIQEGEDIDLLVADNDIRRIADLFVPFPAGQVLDVYSVSGVEGTSYKGVPYYPPHIAEEILESRIWYRDLYAVPDTRRHFLALAYHAVMHKGRKSGLPHLGEPAYPTPDHDYLGNIQKLAQVAGIEQSFRTFGDVYDYLKAQNWIPELDAMRKLARIQNDPWLLALLPDESYDMSKGEMVVFVIREWALKRKKLDFIVELLKAYHLDILLVHKLSPDEQEIAKRELRGGNWAQEPGGFPGCLIVCYDFYPEAPTPEEIAERPFVKNMRITTIKNKIRNGVNADVLLFHHANCVHSADDELEAWAYIRSVIPWAINELEIQVEERRKLAADSLVEAPL